MNTGINAAINHVVDAVSSPDQLSDQRRGPAARLLAAREAPNMKQTVISARNAECACEG